MFSTNEEFTELKRAVHLLKKGYEIQKISVRMRGMSKILL